MRATRPGEDGGIGGEQFVFPIWNPRERDETPFARELSCVPRSYSLFTASRDPLNRSRLTVQRTTKQTKGGSQATATVKNGSTTWYTKTRQQLFPVARIDTGRRALFLGSALSLGAFAALGRLKSLGAGEESLHQRRAFTSLIGWSASAALIGKFDTTASDPTRKSARQTTVIKEL